MQCSAELCVKRPVFATVLSSVILVVGGVFYKQLGVDQFPKIDFPVIVVQTTLPGAAPEDVETEISDKIEGAVNTISGIDELRSNSSEGVSQVIIQFTLEKNVDVAAQEVQQKINMVLPELPKGIDPPIVQKFDPDAQPVLFIALRNANADVREITDLADRVVRRRLESVNGVGQVTLHRRPQAPDQRAGRSGQAEGARHRPAEVGAAINAQNITLPGGRLDISRDYLTVRVNGRVQSLDELRAVIVATSTVARFASTRWPPSKTASKTWPPPRCGTGSARCCSRCASSRAPTPSRSSIRFASAWPRCRKSCLPATRSRCSATARRWFAPAPRRSPST